MVYVVTVKISLRLRGPGVRPFGAFDKVHDILQTVGEFLEILTLDEEFVFLVGVLAVDIVEKFLAFGDADKKVLVNGVFYIEEVSADSCFDDFGIDFVSRVGFSRFVHFLKALLRVRVFVFEGKSSNYIYVWGLREMGEEGSCGQSSYLCGPFH